MTKIKIYKKKDILTGFECKGHTGYADFGKDIVCASVSSLVQSCILGLQKVVGLDIKYKIDEEKGYIKFELPEGLDKDNLHDSQVLLLTLKDSLENLQSGYSQYISMEVIENVY